jgi:hypothetical protein
MDFKHKKKGAKTRAKKIAQTITTTKLPPSFPPLDELLRKKEGITHPHSRANGAQPGTNHACAQGSDTNTHACMWIVPREAEAGAQGNLGMVDFKAPHKELSNGQHVALKVLYEHKYGKLPPTEWRRLCKSRKLAAAKRAMQQELGVCCSCNHVE